MFSPVQLKKDVGIVISSMMGGTTKRFAGLSFSRRYHTVVLRGYGVVPGEIFNSIFNPEMKFLVDSPPP